MENNKLLHWKVAGEILSLISAIFFPHAKTKCRSIDTCGIFKKIQQGVKTKTFRRFFFLKTKWKTGELEGI